MTSKRFVDLLHQKECWFWCRLRWSPEEDIVLERIGESPEDAYFEWLGTRSDMFRFDAPAELIKAHEAEEEKKRGDMGIPEWLYWEERNDGIVEAIESTLDRSSSDDLPTWARFGLENGIAPFQPFLLRFPMPHYTKTRRLIFLDYNPRNCIQFGSRAGTEARSRLRLLRAR